jgi:hypothetical protein
VGVVTRPADAHVTIEVDGWPWLQGSGEEPLRLNAALLPPGEHALRAIVTSGDQRLVSPRISVHIGGEAAAATGTGRLDLVASTSAIGLAAQAAKADPGIGPATGGGAMQWLSGSQNWVPGPQPPAAAAAIRIDDGALPPPRRVVVGAGQGIAFGTPPPPAELGSGPALTAGPLLTKVWRPAAGGTWRLTIHGQPAWVTVVESPGLWLGGPPPGAVLRGPVTLTPAVAVGLGAVTLLDGDHPLATWPAGQMPTAVQLDPARLAAGTHLLRLIAVGADGARVVGPALPLTVPPT